MVISHNQQHILSQQNGSRLVWEGYGGGGEAISWKAAFWSMFKGHVGISHFLQRLKMQRNRNMVSFQRFFCRLLKLESMSPSEVPLLQYIIFLCAALKRILKQRKAMLEAGEADWAMGEAFAFGSLLQDKVHVRVSGECIVIKYTDHTL